MKVDAIVNAANTDLQQGGGVCGAIFKAAGPKCLQEACNNLAPIKTGEAVFTPGFDLPATFIIHAAGPIYKQWSKKQSEQLLRDAYTNALIQAVKNKCTSIAFPLISSGIYGYPKDKALEVARTAIQDFLQDLKRKYKWEFIFLGANIDAVATASKFGIGADRALDYLADSEGTKLSYATMSRTVSEYRNSGMIDGASFDEIRDDVKRRGRRQ